VAADELLFDGERCVGATLRDTDTETATAFEQRASCVINAAGPRAYRRPGLAAPAVKLVKGEHRVLQEIADLEHAFLLTASSDGRVFFVILWNGGTLVDTTESSALDAIGIGVDEAETKYLLDAVNALMPGLAWTPDDVISRFAGVRSLQAVYAERLAAVSRQFTVLRPRSGLVWLLGGKYTTARSLTLPHGTGISRVEAPIDENPDWAQRIHPDVPYLRPEVVLSVRDEMPRTDEDIVRRRMPLNRVVPPGEWLAEVKALVMVVVAA